jgi:hypothetical protein
MEMNSMRAFLVGMGLMALLAIVAVAGQTKAPTPTQLPPNWRSWTHITTGVIYSEKHPLFGAFGGVHHIYANPTAAKAYRNNARKFPDGSQIVFVLYEAKDENGMYVAGKKKVTALMVKDSRRYAQSGGWGWQAWDASGKPIVTDPVGQCQGCHNQVKERDRVFSRWTP